MVLAQKVGKERSFLAGFLLTIVTFGIYAIYWNYRAHNELYRQFELEREARDEGMVWYVLGLTLQPLLVAYMWIFSSNVDYLRRRIGLPRRMSPGKFVLVAGGGVVSVALAIILLAVATFTVPEDAEQADIDAAIAPYDMAVLGFFLLGVLLLAVAYWGLQRDINEVWDAYDARLAYLRRHPEELAQAAPAADLRTKLDALRGEHPMLRALPELEALAARATLGDATARERADTLLADVAGLLEERARLLPVQEEPAAAERLDVLEAALFVPSEARVAEGEGQTW